MARARKAKPQPSSNPSITSVAIPLAALPAGLVNPLVEAFNAILTNFSERRWEPSELNGGKFCEIVYSILRGHVDGVYPATPSKPPNMVADCQALEKADKTKFTRSVRIQIPRMLIALYEVRNNRNVGHVGGEVDPNEMDAVVVVYMTKWIMAELVRVFHDISTEEAEQIVGSLVERIIPVVWKVGTIRRVLDPTFSMKDRALILLHSHSGPVSETDLVSWVDHSNSSVFRRDILRPAHAARLLEYDPKTGLVEISPTGIAHAEALLTGNKTDRRTPPTRRKTASRRK